MLLSLFEKGHMNAPIVLQCKYRQHIYLIIPVVGNNISNKLRRFGPSKINKSKSEFTEQI